MCDAAGAGSNRLTPQRWERLVRLLDEALVRSDAERSAFLTAACAGDEELRREIDSLLNEHERDDAPLERLASAVRMTLRVRGDEPDAGIGRTIGPYTIQREIGRGGMGVVYVAQRTDGQYERQVALKIIQNRARDERELDRFLTERQILADMSHPGIAQLFDGGLTDEGLPYFTMEYVEGLPIDEYCGTYGLDVKGRLRLFMDVCDAVAAAHRKLIVHRDLKPANILVTAQRAVKLVDFGIAKPLAPAEDHLTRTGGSLFTPDYASPEQVRGYPVTAATDVYSLGAVLYKLLTGVKPHRFTSRTPADLERTICEREPIRPSQAVVALCTSPKLSNSSDRGSTVGQPQLERVARTLAGDLDTIVMKALHKEPARRYGSVDAMRQDIVNYLSGRCVCARPDSFAYRAGKFGTRNCRTIVAAALGITFAAIAAFAARSLGSSARAGVTSDSASAPIRSVAVLPLEDLSDDPAQEYFADGVTEQLIADLSKIGTLRVISRTSVMQYKKAHKPLPAIARELNVDAVVEGSVVRTGDRMRITARLIRASTEKSLWTRSYERDLHDVLALQSELARSIASEVNITLTPQEEAFLATARAVDPEAHQLFLLGRFHANKATEDGLKKAIQYFELAIAKDPGDPSAYVGLAEAYIGMSSWYVSPRQAMPKAKAAALTALTLDQSLASAHAALGLVHLLYDWDGPAAERELRLAIQLSPSLSSAHLNYGAYLLTAERPEEAAQEVRRAIELDPLSVRTDTRGAVFMVFARRYDEAIALARKGQDLDPNFPFSIAWEGMAQAEQGQFPEAVGNLQKAARLSSHPTILSLGAHVHAVAGQKAEAKQLIQQAERIAQHRYFCPYEIGTAYVSLGDADTAFKWFRKGIEDRADCMAWLDVEPWIAPIRTDSRYAQLVRDVGLTPRASATPRR